jgi:predicted nucleic acid-binding protein
MKWLLDTNTLNYLFRNEPTLRGNFEKTRADPDNVFVLSPMVDFEFRRYMVLKNASRNLARYEALVQNWLPPNFLKDDWHLAVSLWADCHRAGLPIDDADLLIAVTALRQNAVLVTSKTRHFVDLGLTLADWRQTC